MLTEKEGRCQPKSREATGVGMLNVQGLERAGVSCYAIPKMSVEPNDTCYCPGATLWN